VHVHPNFVATFVSLCHYRTRGDRRSAKRPPYLGDKKRNISS